MGIELFGSFVVGEGVYFVKIPGALKTVQGMKKLNFEKDESRCFRFFTKNIIEINRNDSEKTHKKALFHIILSEVGILLRNLSVVIR